MATAVGEDEMPAADEGASEDEVSVRDMVRTVARARVEVVTPHLKRLEVRASFGAPRHARCGPLKFSTAAVPSTSTSLDPGRDIVLDR